ncbi:hypothetical protein IEQ34_018851 [Dendrobium chrysotoxum]|uniref:Uncharacterized protein n=1 Tax=Dendrobium chrysotoxum TaxID=161865 RepID=A0AAV7G6Y8_DENCH|nr:hypothetical protein IEQ34_018851 [Dendrobium chrysotoxum]
MMVFCLFDTLIVFLYPTAGSLNSSLFFELMEKNKNQVWQFSEWGQPSILIWNQWTAAGDHSKWLNSKVYGLENLSSSRRRVLDSSGRDLAAALVDFPLLELQGCKGVRPGIKAAIFGSKFWTKGEGRKEL